MSNEYLKKIDGNQAINTQIEDINHDFTVLAKRIQEQSKIISLFDTIHIESIYSVTDYSKEPNQFIALKWNTMANYSGVFISGGEAWEFQGKTVESGDILIKLPGNELLQIKNQTNTFAPITYDPSTSQVIYTDNPSSSTTSITISTISAAAIHGIVRQMTITDAGTYCSQSPAATSFYLLNGESVMWNHSYCTDTVPSSIINSLGIGSNNPLLAIVFESVEN